MTTPTTPPPAQQPYSPRNTAIFLGSITVITLIALITGDPHASDSPCERDYYTVYANRGTAWDIGIEQYCENRNSGPIDPYGLHDDF